MFMHLEHPAIRKTFIFLLTDLVFSDVVTKILIRVLNLLWTDWYLSFTTPLFFILKASWTSCETVFGNFLLIWLAPTPMYNSNAHWVPLWVCLQPGFTTTGYSALCGQHLDTDPSSVSPVRVAKIFLPPRMKPNHRYSVSPSPCHLATCIMPWEVLSESFSICRKAQV